MIHPHSYHYIDPENSEHRIYKVTWCLPFESWNYIHESNHLSFFLMALIDITPKENTDSWNRLSSLNVSFEEPIPNKEEIVSQLNRAYNSFPKVGTAKSIRNSSDTASGPSLALVLSSCVTWGTSLNLTVAHITCK